MADSALSNPDVPDPADSRVELIRIAAIVGMALGLSGVLCLPFRAFFEVAGPPREGAPPLGYWPGIFAVAGLLLSIVLCFGSMAAFRLKPIARPLLIIYALGSLLFGVAGVIFYARALLPNEGRNLVMRWGGMGLTYELLMWPAAILFSLYLLYAMTRPAAKAVFAKGAARERMDRADR